MDQEIRFRTNSNIKRYQERREWFTSRIGKTLWRDKSSCQCGACDSVYKNGITVGDSDHAAYLNDISAEYPLTYYDTKQERDENESLYLSQLQAKEKEVEELKEKVSRINESLTNELTVRDVQLQQSKEDNQRLRGAVKEYISTLDEYATIKTGGLVPMVEAKLKLEEALQQKKVLTVTA